MFGNEETQSVRSFYPLLLAWIMVVVDSILPAEFLRTFLVVTKSSYVATKHHPRRNSTGTCVDVFRSGQPHIIVTHVPSVLPVLPEEKQTAVRICLLRFLHSPRYIGQLLASISDVFIVEKIMSVYSGS